MRGRAERALGRDRCGARRVSSGRLETSYPVTSRRLAAHLCTEPSSPRTSSVTEREALGTDD